MCGLFRKDIFNVLCAEITLIKSRTNHQMKKGVRVLAEFIVVTLDVRFICDFRTVWELS